jgi:EF-P beta-lysylation protein EpmB
MRKGDPRDPLLLQVLPVGRELLPRPGFVADPLAERGGLPAPAHPDGATRSVRPARGLLHKYRGRALLILTGACPIHCRYCFRRHFPYEEESAAAGGWEEALGYLEADPSIEEVILSGGDPLLVPDRFLAELALRLAAIPHVKRLRIHSRTPVVLPERVDGDLLAWIGATRLAPVLVLHANHAREIDGAVAAAMADLKAAGVTLLNQSVLLAGVNDSASALTELSQALFEVGVLPYYLHLLDRVAGAAHFEVDEAAARRLMAEVASRLPGYLVPRLVREVPGAPAKVPVSFEQMP